MARIRLDMGAAPVKPVHIGKIFAVLYKNYPDFLCALRQKFFRCLETSSNASGFRDRQFVFWGVRDLSSEGQCTELPPGVD